MMSSIAPVWTCGCTGEDNALDMSKKGTTMTTGAITPGYEHSEGRIAKSIEQQTAKLPSDAFLWMAVGSMITSATLQAMGNKHVSLFIGQWAPTFLIFGLYNKLVKQLGSDRTENAI
jgi:hypothetical protein